MDANCAQGKKMTLSVLAAQHCMQTKKNEKKVS